MMKRRAFSLFFLALAIGLGAATLANRWIQDRLSPIADAQASTTPVVVAATEIPFATLIQDVHLKTIAWPNEAIPENVFHRIEDVVGKVSNQKLLEREIVMTDRVVDQVQGSTLSAIISPNKRAVTVRVNDVIGVAGFLLPGNRVDVLASRMEQSRAYTKTILENIKVLAVDQTASPDENQPVVVRAVTLELSPKHGEKLVRATQEGTVQLSLRNPTDESKLVSKQKQSTPVKRTGPLVSNVTVIRGTTVDVSKVRL